MLSKTSLKNAATHDAWLRLDHQLCFALYSSSLAMTKIYKPLLEPLGLTYPQYLVMLVLWEQDELSVSQLGERLQLDSGTLTPLLKRLEQAELLQRRRDPADERRVLLALTASGRSLKAQALSVPQQIACAAACPLDELQSLTLSLQQLRQQLLKASESPPAA
jgi:DNA-binding MarR family transcriptional regulator